MNIIGRELEVGIGVESVRGTALLGRWGKKLVATILPKNQKVVDESSDNGFEDSPSARIVKEWFEGDIEGNVHADLIGYLLTNIYGNVQSTLVGSGVYSHAFSLLHNVEHPSVSIFRKDGDVINEKYGGGVVGNLDINAVSDDYVKFKTTIALSNSASSAESPSYNAEYDFVGRDVTIKMADTEAGLSGANAIKVKSASIKFNNNPINDHNCGSYSPDMYNSLLGIEVEITKNFNSTDYEDLYKSNDYKYMQISIEGEADIGGGNKPKIVLTLNKGQIQAWERSGNVGDLVEETFTVKAFKNDEDGEASTVLLQNLTSEYIIGS